MAIIKTITYEYAFWEWLKQSDNYKDNFTLEGAKALQLYLDDLSDDIGQSIDWDPIAWCCEYSEYATPLEGYNEHHGRDDDGIGTAIGEDNTEKNANAQALEWFQDNTSVIELDNGGIIVAEF